MFTFDWKTHPLVVSCICRLISQKCWKLHVVHNNCNHVHQNKDLSLEICLNWDSSLEIFPQINSPCICLAKGELPSLNLIWQDNKNKFLHFIYSTIILSNLIIIIIIKFLLLLSLSSLSFSLSVSLLSLSLFNLVEVHGVFLGDS